jgi:hypothetical protein
MSLDTVLPEAKLAIIRRIDALHLDHPFADSRMLRDLLRGKVIATGREMVRTMMRRMGIEALYRRPNTSKPCPVQDLSISSARLGGRAALGGTRPTDRRIGRVRLDDAV